MVIDMVGQSDMEPGKSREVKLPPVRGQMERFTPEQPQKFAMSGSDFNTAAPWSEGPRRMGADKTGDYVWVGDWWRGNLIKIDIRTQKTTFGSLPTPDAVPPYHTAADSELN